MDLAFLDPIRRLLENEEAVEKAEAVVRGFSGYSSNVSYGASTTGAGYAAPSSGYGAYSARSGEGVELTPEQKALFPELTELRQQIENLQASEKSLREQIYFNTAGQTDGINAADINQISYTY